MAVMYVLEPHVNKIKRTVKSVINDIKTETFSVAKIILLGSAVKNELKPTSDVDVCIVLRDGDTYENSGLHAISAVERYLSERFTAVCDVDYVVCNQDALDRRDRVFSSIAEEGLIIWQRTEA